MLLFNIKTQQEVAVGNDCNTWAILRFAYGQEVVCGPRRMGEHGCEIRQIFVGLTEPREAVGRVTFIHDWEDI